MIGDLFRRTFRLDLSAAPRGAPSPYTLFRKPLSGPWRIGLGVASVVTVLIVYTLASWYRQTDRVWLALEPDTLTRLRADGIPESVLARWEPLADGQFHPQDEFFDAVPGAKVTARVLDELGAPPAVAEKLDPLVNREFADREALQAALSGLLTSEELRAWGGLVEKLARRAYADELGPRLRQRSRVEERLIPTWRQWWERRNTNDLLLPNWSQLWRLGVVPSFTPVEKGRLAPPADLAPALEAEKEKLLDHFRKDRPERLEAQRERLKGLAESAGAQRLRSEVLRGQALEVHFLPSERKRLQNEEEEVLGQLPAETRTRAEDGLKAVRAGVQSEQDRLIVYKIRLWEDVKATFGRFFLGLSVSVLVALTLGVLMGCYSPIDAYCQPPMAVLAKVPGTVMATLFMVIVGLNWKFYQAMIYFGMIPMLTLTFYVYTREVPEELIYKARTLGASQAECIFSVILPNILPKVMETVRLSVGPAFIFLYAAELMFGNEGEGLGCTLRLVDKKGLIETPTAYFYIAVIAFFGFVIDWSLRWAQRKLFTWYYPE